MLLCMAWGDSWEGGGTGSSCCSCPLDSSPGCSSSLLLPALTHPLTHSHTLTDSPCVPTAYPGHSSDVDVVAWHPNSHYVATGSGDRTVRLWDVASGATVRLMGGQAGAVTALAFSPDGTALAAGTEGGSVALFDLASGRR